MPSLRAPFPYFGGKSKIAPTVWRAFGEVAQYIEPFCGSAAVLLAAPRIASLEVVGDANCFIANFWRATKHQPHEVAHHADYPVSHIDLGARHNWLRGQRERLAAELMDPDWPGDAKVAGWWLWGQCSWIGRCEGEPTEGHGQVPHISDAGMGVQSVRHVLGAGKSPLYPPQGDTLTSAGSVAKQWLAALSQRLERVRIIHGDWSRGLNSKYADNGNLPTAVFLDPPYEGTESLYNDGAVLADVVTWAREFGADPKHRVVLCGQVGDYELEGWTAHAWKRWSVTYGGKDKQARHEDCLYLSPGCLPIEAPQMELAL